MNWIALAIGLFWLGVLRRVERGRADTAWRIEPAGPTPASLPRLAVVIPARNEADNIGPCVRAVLASDHPDFTVDVWDDGSVDGTGALALAAGAVVHAGDGSLPAGWKGKPWALHRATREIAADWLLFLDADVRVHPAALSRAHARAIADGADLLTGFGRLEMVGFWERVVQPSVGGLILAGNDLGRINADARPTRVIANGQFLLVRRAAYEAVGGHEAVKDDILDDVGLARAFAGAGLVVRCYFMRELFTCRMYRSLAEIWHGWTKNLYAGMQRKPGLVVLVSVVTIVYFVAPYPLLVWAVARGEGVAAAVTLLALMHAIRLRLDRLFGQDPRFGLLQPLGALVLLALLWGSVWRSTRGGMRWKGREYGPLPGGES
jgi:hypothetical protein